MNFREKLADWISGGKLTLYRDANRQYIKCMYDLEDEVVNLRKALMNIRCQETKGANATVRRMVKIADEALSGE